MQEQGNRFKLPLLSRDNITLDPVSVVTDWPIYDISRRKEEIMAAVIAESVQYLMAHYPKSGEIREVIALTLYLEKIRMAREPWKIDPKDERRFWDGIRRELYKSDTQQVGRQTADSVSMGLLRQIVERYCREITGNFDPGIYRMAKIILPHLFARMLNASTGQIRGIIRPKVMLENRLFVTGPVERIRRLSQQGTIILVPTHFSNLDSIMVGFGMDMIGLPAFQYGAGLNLFNSRFLGYFMGNLGAYKLDRRKKNPVYLETLKAFSRINIFNGAHTLFFPGGTRSRSGALETRLKLGLLGTIVEAQRMHFEQAESTGKPAKRIFILPLTISYHFVLEAKTLIEQHLRRTGKESYITIDDEFSSIYKVAKFFWQTFAKSSEITLSMGAPMDIFGNMVNDEGESLDRQGKVLDLRGYFMSRGTLNADRQREMEYTSLLGNVIRAKFLKYNVVYSSHTVAFVAFELIRQKFPKSDLFTLLRTPEEDWELTYDNFSLAMTRVLDRLRSLSKEGRLLLADHMHADLEDLIDHGIRNIGIYHSKEPLMKTKDGAIVSEDIKLLLFYHNRLEGYGLEAYIG